MVFLRFAEALLVLAAAGWESTDVGVIFLAAIARCRASLWDDSIVSPTLSALLTFSEKVIGIATHLNGRVQASGQKFNKYTIGILKFKNCTVPLEIPEKLLKSRGSGRRLWLSMMPGRAQSRLRPSHWTWPGLGFWGPAWPEAEAGTSLVQIGTK